MGAKGQDFKERLRKAIWQCGRWESERHKQLGQVFGTTLPPMALCWEYQASVERAVQSTEKRLIRQCALFKRCYIAERTG